MRNIRAKALSYVTQTFRFEYMSLKQESLAYRKKYRGVIEIRSRVRMKTGHDLALAYTPGVAFPCEEIHKDRGNVYKYTNKWNSVAIVTDGTAVLGLGDIGAEAALPVMEGKAVLFKVLAGVDAYPLCLATTDIEKIVETVKMISPGFGGINLEDISGPRCFEIERKLKEQLDIPVFHDDQHGTAVVVLAGLLNALKITGRKISEVSIAVNGAGAGAIAVSRFLISAGVKNIVLCDRAGAVYRGRFEHMNFAKQEIAEISNLRLEKGALGRVIRGKDIFIGLSAAGLVSWEMVRSMAPGPIVFALANPVPEIMPDEAKKAGARVVATGRSNLPNQINNALGFPGIFRGALDSRAKAITEEMKMAASRAIAGLISKRDLRPDYIIPNPLDRRVVPAVASAVRRVRKR